MFAGSAFRCIPPIRQSGSLNLRRVKSCIAALEALAQLMLLIGRMRDLEQPSRDMWGMHQLCDNSATVAVSRKQLSMTKPLCYVLQAAGFYCCRFAVEMVGQRIAGVRNEWADAPAVTWTWALSHQPCVPALHRQQACRRHSERHSACTRGHGRWKFMTTTPAPHAVARCIDSQNFSTNV